MDLETRDPFNEEDWEENLRDDMYYLCIYSDNWADEMDIDGFKIFKEKDWLVYKEAFENCKKRFTFCIGTNEDIEYRNGADLLRSISERKINLVEKQTIERLFRLRRGEFGFFPGRDLVR